MQQQKWDPLVCLLMEKMGIFCVCFVCVHVVWFLVQHRADQPTETLFSSPSLITVSEPHTPRGMLRLYPLMSIDITLTSFLGDGYTQGWKSHTHSLSERWIAYKEMRVKGLQRATLQCSYSPCEWRVREKESVWMNSVLTHTNRSITLIQEAIWRL